MLALRFSSLLSTCLIKETGKVNTRVNGGYDFWRMSA